MGASLRDGARLSRNEAVLDYARRFAAEFDPPAVSEARPPSFAPTAYSYDYNGDDNVDDVTLYTLRGDDGQNGGTHGGCSQTAHTFVGPRLYDVAAAPAAEIAGHTLVQVGGGARRWCESP